MPYDPKVINVANNMFFVGFEIDLEQFGKVKTRALLFGVLTFSLPFSGALLLGYLTGYDWAASTLIGSIIASHTLLAYPILVKY